MRLHQPAGFLLLFWPCSWSIILAEDGIAINIYLLAIFLIGSIAIRGAGCVINDIWDREIDAKVERTKNRPLASGALSVKAALILLFLLLIIGLFILFELGKIAAIYSFIAFGLAIVYPLMKRFFPLPQLFLGITFNLGSIIVWVAIKGEISLPAILLYIGGIFWTIGYDTIYAHQDIKDDKKLGVKSTAISFGKLNKTIIFTCFIIFHVMLTSATFINGFTLAPLMLAPLALDLARQVITFDLKNPKDCMSKFKHNAFISGFLALLGIYLSKII